MCYIDVSQAKPTPQKLIQTQWGNINLYVSHICFYTSCIVFLGHHDHHHPQSPAGSYLQHPHVHVQLPNSVHLDITGPEMSISMSIASLSVPYNLWLQISNLSQSRLFYFKDSHPASHCCDPDKGAFPHHFSSCQVAVMLCCYIYSTFLLLKLIRCIQGGWSRFHF